MIPEGIETRIYGNIISINEESLSDVEIKIAEYLVSSNGGCFACPAPTHYNYEFVDYVQNIYLDNIGSFDFTFFTTGNGNFYRIFVGNFPEINFNQSEIPFVEQNIHEPLLLDLTLEANDMRFIGEEYYFIHEVEKLYLCEISLEFNLINFDPITINHHQTFRSNNREINNFDHPTVVKLFIDKANPQTLILRRTKENSIKEKAEYTFPASNIESTTFQNITVNESDFTEY